MLSTAQTGLQLQLLTVTYTTNNIFKKDVPCQLCCAIFITATFLLWDGDNRLKSHTAKLEEFIGIEIGCQIVSIINVYT